MHEAEKRIVLGDGGLGVRNGVQSSERNSASGVQCSDKQVNRGRCRAGVEEGVYIYIFANSVLICSPSKGIQGSCKLSCQPT